MLDAGCWMLDAGCWMLDAGKLLVFCDSSQINYKLFAVTVYYITASSLFPLPSDITLLN
jgi:hypothetical protein